MSLMSCPAAIAWTFCPGIGADTGAWAKQSERPSDSNFLNLARYNAVIRSPLVSTYQPASSLAPSRLFVVYVVTGMVILLSVLYVLPRAGPPSEGRALAGCPGSRGPAMSRA